MLQTVSHAVLLIVAAAVAVIGALTVRRTRNMDSFLPGGRKIGPWMSAFAYGTTCFSGAIFAKKGVM